MKIKIQRPYLAKTITSLHRDLLNLVDAFQIVVMASTMLSGMQMAQRPCTAQRSGFAGQAVRVPVRPAAPRMMRSAVAAAETKTETEKKAWTAPALDPSWPSPIFGGSTGGLLRKAQVTC